MAVRHRHPVSQTPQFDEPLIPPTARPRPPTARPDPLRAHPPDRAPSAHPCCERGSFACARRRGGGPPAWIWRTGPAPLGVAWDRQQRLATPPSVTTPRRKARQKSTCTARFQPPLDQKLAISRAGIDWTLASAHARSGGKNAARERRPTNCGSADVPSADKTTSGADAALDRRGMCAGAPELRGAPVRMTTAMHPHLR